MTTLKHPRIPGLSVDVPEGDAARWAAQGWVDETPAPAAPFVEDEVADELPVERPKRHRK